MFDHEATSAPKKNYSFKLNNNLTVIASETADIKNAYSFRNLVQTKAIDKINNDLEFARILWITKNLTVQDETDEEYFISFAEYCGYDSWSDYIKEELNITPARANKFVRVHEKFQIELGHKFDPEKHSLDIGKLFIIARIANAQNLNKLIRSCRNITQRELQALLNGKMYKNDTRYSKTQRAAVALAQTIFGKELSYHALLDKICEEFLKTNKKHLKAA